MRTIPFEFSFLDHIAEICFHFEIKESFSVDQWQKIQIKSISLRL